MIFRLRILSSAQSAGHHLFKGNGGRTDVNSCSLTSPLGYKLVWNRVRGYFPRDLASVLARASRVIEEPGSSS